MMPDVDRSSTAKAGKSQAKIHCKSHSHSQSQSQIQSRGRGRPRLTERSKVVQLAGTGRKDHLATIASSMWSIFLSNERSYVPMMPKLAWHNINGRQRVQHRRRPPTGSNPETWLIFAFDFFSGRKPQQRPQISENKRSANSLWVNEL